MKKLHLSALSNGTAKIGQMLRNALYSNEIMIRLLFRIGKYLSSEFKEL